MTTRTRCTATTRSGDRCRNYAEPYNAVCALHGLPETRPQFRPRTDWSKWRWRDQGPRKYAVGDTVIWTKPADGSKHTGTIVWHVELNADDPEDAAIDLERTGPVYEIEFTPDQDVEIQVAETNLAPAADQDGA